MDFYINHLPFLMLNPEQYITEKLNRMSGLDIALCDIEDPILAQRIAQSNARYWFFDYVESRKNSDNSMKRNENELAALYSIIDICREENATPIMITTPFLKEYNDTVAENDPAFYEDFYGIINEVSARTGTPYYDYSRDERFSGDYSLFSDTTHLNREGGLKFTKIVTEEVLGW